VNGDSLKPPNAPERLDAMVQSRVMVVKRDTSGVGSFARSVGFSEFSPAGLRYFNAVVLGGRFDVGKCEIAICVRDVVDLVEPRKGIAHVRGVDQRFLSLLGKGEDRVRKIVAFTRRQLAVRCVGFEGDHEPGIPDMPRRQTWDL